MRHRLCQVRERLLDEVQFLRVHRQIAGRLFEEASAAAIPRPFVYTHDFVTQCLIKLVELRLHGGNVRLPEGQWRTLRIYEWEHLITNTQPTYHRDDVPGCRL